MIWFGWNADSNPKPVQASAVNDGFAVYDYTIYEIMQGQWRYFIAFSLFFSKMCGRYHQFRITGGQRIPPNVSFKPFFDYIQQKYSAPNLWLGSIF